MVMMGEGVEEGGQRQEEEGEGDGGGEGEGEERWRRVIRKDTVNQGSPSVIQTGFVEFQLV